MRHDVVLEAVASAAVDEGDGWMQRRGGERLAAPAMVRAVWLAGLIALGVLSMLMGAGTASAATHAGAARSCGAPAAAPATVGTSGASITLARTKGPVGMSQTVSGTGWPAGATVVLGVDARDSGGTLYGVAGSGATAIVAADGTFSVTFPTPQPDGCGPISQTSDVLFVAHTSDNSVSAEAPFTYTFPPTLVSHSGQQVRPGFAVSLAGENWEPGEQVTITSGVTPDATPGCVGVTTPSCPAGTPVLSATVHATASDTGEISLTYSLPGGLAARTGVLVQATGTGPLYGTVSAPPLEFLILPAMDPTLTLDKATGAAGIAVTVHGERWNPGDTVQIEYCRDQAMYIQPAPASSSGQGELRCEPQSAQMLGAVIVNKSGSFSTTVSIPTNARIGPITIQARVPDDIFGLLVYAQAVPFKIVPPPLPWSRQHPRMSLALAIARPAVPALILGVLLLAVYLWSRQRARATAAAHAMTAGNGKP